MIFRILWIKANIIYTQKQTHTHIYLHIHIDIFGLPGCLSGKNLPASGGDRGNMGSIPGSGKSPGEGNGNPLQYMELCGLQPIGSRVRHNLVTKQQQHITCSHCAIDINGYISGLNSFKNWNNFQQQTLDQKIFELNAFYFICEFFIFLVKAIFIKKTLHTSQSRDSIFFISLHYIETILPLSLPFTILIFLKDNMIWDE